MSPFARALSVLVFAPCALAACGDDVGSPPDASPEPAAWSRELPAASVMGERRGLVPARGINHLHSPYSHDACDGNPRPGGVPDEECLAHLRAALCTTRIDFANLTDHDASMADEDFSALFSMRGADTAIMRGSLQIGSRITCDNGHVVSVSVGGENPIMPIMLDHHVEGTVAERREIYNANTAAAAAAFRAAGGLVWIPHTEDKTLEKLRELSPDGLEVYNLHANIDPDIRADYLGLDRAGGITGAIEFADTQPGHPEPDLAILSFLSPNGPAIEKWNALLGDGRHVSITAGSDAHENALPITMGDGERGDSYRRVMRWFGNVVLVENPGDVDQIQEALDAGRNFAVFEVFGTPENFDVVARAGGSTYELGGTVPVAAQATLSLTMPTIRGLDPSLPTPTITARVIHVAPGGAVATICTVDGATTPGTSQFPIHAPGAYRVEVEIVPLHLGPHLHDLGPSLSTTVRPWIYTGAIYVE